MAWNAGKPAMGNQISADIPNIEENFDYVLLGDGTEGRVLRLSKCVIADSSITSSVKVYLEDLWNGDDVDSSGSPHEITAGDSDTNWSFDSNGYVLTIEAAGLSGNVVAALGWPSKYNSITPPGSVRVSFASNDITLECFTDTGAEREWHDLVVASGDYVEITILYITDA